MSILMTLILWTWGLTPLWVNIIGTIIMGMRACLKVLIPLLKNREDY